MPQGIDGGAASDGEGGVVTAEHTAREYPLPRLVRVDWIRGHNGDRTQHAVAFLVAESETHLVLSDQFDGKHPVSRRMWTIDRGDVVTIDSVGSGRLLFDGPNVTSYPNATAAAPSMATHVHRWGPMKPIAPDGDMGRECETCVAYQPEHAHG